jgi:hypothetical protein
LSSSRASSLLQGRVGKNKQPGVDVSEDDGDRHTNARL